MGEPDGKGEPTDVFGCLDAQGFVLTKIVLLDQSYHPIDVDQPVDRKVPI